MEVDSNHRSKLQQIYSLSPLATRESIHRSFLTAIHHNILNIKIQPQNKIYPISLRITADVFGIATIK